MLNPAPTDWTSFGGGLSLGRIGTNDWLVFFNCCNSRPGVSARRISPQGELREPMYSIGAGGTREQTPSPRRRARKRVQNIQGAHAYKQGRIDEATNSFPNSVNW